jgi:Transglutaminase-like superfamily
MPLLTTQTTPSGSSRFVLRDDVFLVGSGLEARLIDLRSGRFFALDQVGERMVSIALDEGSERVAATVAEEAGVDPEVVAADWREFAARLRRLGLLRQATSGLATYAARPIRRRQSWWPSPSARTLLALAWGCLRTFGLARTVRRLGGRPVVDAQAEPPCGPAEALAIAAVDEAVRKAAAGMLLNPECKERALVAWHLLRTRHGLRPQLVVGITVYPFTAHAWVECEGRYVTDDEHRCLGFLPVARYV